jgi:hypothetical protein
MFQFQIFDVLIGTTALTLITRDPFCPCRADLASLDPAYKLVHPPVFSVWS